MALAERLRGCLREHGVAFDDANSFLPHVTLARRVRLPKGELPALSFPLPCEAARVTLFRSYLEKTGARYKALYTVELGESHG